MFFQRLWYRKWDDCRRFYGINRKDEEISDQHCFDMMKDFVRTVKIGRANTARKILKILETLRLKLEGSSNDGQSENQAQLGQQLVPLFGHLHPETELCISRSENIFFENVLSQIEMAHENYMLPSNFRVSFAFLVCVNFELITKLFQKYSPLLVRQSLALQTNFWQTMSSIIADISQSYLPLIKGFCNVLPTSIDPMERLWLAESGYWLCYMTIPGKDRPQTSSNDQLFSIMFAEWPESKMLIIQVTRLLKFSSSFRLVATNRALVFALAFFKSLSDNEKLSFNTRNYLIEISKVVEYLVRSKLESEEESNMLDEMLMAMKDVLNCRFYALRCLTERYATTQHRAYYVLRPAVKSIYQHFGFTGNKICSCPSTIQCECNIRWCTYKVLHYYSNIDLFEFSNPGHHIDLCSPFTNRSLEQIEQQPVSEEIGDRVSTI